MMRYLQRLGKSLMLPVACLPVAAVLQGIGYWIDPTGWGANNVIAAFLLKGGGCLIDQMPILFAIGVAVGMSDDNNLTFYRCCSYAYKNSSRKGRPCFCKNTDTVYRYFMWFDCSSMLQQI